MSAGALLQEALRRVQSLHLPPGTGDLVLRALQADGEGRAFLADAAWEALAGETARVRGAGVVLLHAASNLGDDLSDGEAHYLERPVQLAPALQWTLQHLGTALALESGASRAAVCHACRLLARAGGWALEEWAARPWDSGRYTAFAEGIAGLQLEAYLALLWDGTTLQPRASAVGVPLGAASLVMADMAEGKARWRALPPSDQGRVRRWLSLQVEPLGSAPELCIRRAAARFQPG